MGDALEHIERWREAGLIDEELAGRLRAFETGGARPAAEVAPAVAASDRPGVVEALLYLGFVVAGVGVFFLIAQQWDGLRSWSRLMLVGVPAVLALVAGATLRLAVDPGLRRAGHVAWLVAIALVAGTLAVAFNEYGDGGIDDHRWMLLTTAVVTVVGALSLWAIAPSHPQAVAVGGAAFFFGESLGAWPDDYTQRLAGAAIAVAGLLLTVTTEVGIFQPRHTARAVSALLVCGGAYHAGIDSAVGWEVLAFVAGGGAIALGVWRASFIYVAIGVLTLLVALITFMFEHFEDRIGAPVALMISGGLLVGAVLVLVQVRNISRQRRLAR